MVINVFVQNEAGSNQKNYHDEKTLEFKFAETVSRAYPYPYGFIIGTNAGDGCNVDCFVITKRPLRTGQTFECEAIALMEQIEDRNVDHNVLAKLPEENIELTTEIQTVLTDFVLNVFQHAAGKQISVGRFLGAEHARAHVMASLECAKQVGPRDSRPQPGSEYGLRRD
jgi:inorganic pyrophosphatase